MVTPEANQMLRLHGHYEAGFLFEAGGIRDQPAVYLEAMEIISREYARIQSDELDKARNKHRMPGNDR